MNMMTMFKESLQEKGEDKMRQDARGIKDGTREGYKQKIAAAKTMTQNPLGHKRLTWLTLQVFIYIYV